MSNLLNESIVDAKALRDSALKNAESVVIEKYAEEVKKTLEDLLEQEEPALGLDPVAPTPELGGDEAVVENGEDVVTDQTDTVPLAAADDLAENEGENLSSTHTEGEDVEVTVDLGALQEAIEALSSEIDEEIELDVMSEEQPSGFDGYDIDRVLSSVLDKAADRMRNPIGKVGGRITTPQIAHIVAKALRLGPAQGQIDQNIIKQIVDMLENDELAHMKTIKNHEIGPRVNRVDAEPLEETETVDEEVDMDGLFDAVMEKLTADMGAELSGWAGTPTSQLKHEQDRQLAHEASTEGEEEETLEEEEEDLNESNEQLEKALADNESLKEELVNYQSTLENLKENLYEVNLSNARLLYTNRVLRNSSLNERQKDKIVEAISGAGSVTEAKTIFETLQSTMEAKPQRSPKSLSEAIGSRSSVLTASRKETKATSQDPFSDRMRRLAGIK